MALVLKDSIEYWIQVGDELRRLHNYCGVMNILSALHNANVGRLSAAWAVRPPGTKLRPPSCRLGFR